MNIASSVGALLGQPVDVIEILSEQERRNTIARLRIKDGTEAGTTVISKQTVGFDDPGSGRDVRLRLYREALAATVLTRIAPGEHTPRCRGVDAGTGLMIFDDLGTAVSLDHSLLSGSPADARTAMIGYVRRLGALHAATAGRLQVWDDVVAELGAPAELLSDRVLEQDGAALDRGLAGLDGHLRDLGLPATGDELAAELEIIRTAVTRPGPFTVLVHRDPCPDNVVLTPSGVRLIDFEFAHPGHALIDGLYPQLPFPTCWCCNTVPDDLGAELAAGYRDELITGVPEAADDDRYTDATANLMAYWLVSGFEWVFTDVLIESRTWGIASTRSRILSRLAAFIEQSRQTGRLPTLGRLADSLQKVLTDRWQQETPLPVYPAFRGSHPSL